MSTQDLECGSKAAADMIRLQFADIVREDDDDRRTKVVTVADPLPPGVETDLHRIIINSYRDDTAGQASLTEFERSRIDFTEVTVPHARACKALAVAAGVDDWLAYYDESLSVDEHRELYRRHGTGEEITLRDMDAVEAGFYG